MIYHTYWFILYAAAFFPVYWYLGDPRWRSWWLLAGCLWFHAHFAGPAGMLPIVVLGGITYACGLARHRWLHFAAIVCCVASLVFYKYVLFLGTAVLNALAPVLGPLPPAEAFSWIPGAPPLAISFFTFEFVHYLVDRIRGEPPIRRPKDFALFTVFFPSLVAGPIKRYQSFLPSLHQGLDRVDVTQVAAGAKRIGIGFIKKVVLADNLTLVIAHYEGHFGALSPFESWLFLAALAARILLDFSGYTDIAIGFALMLGVKLPENFNYPYLARSLRDFWQRWHMSLSNWIRDYIYIPLGGGRRGRSRTLANAIIAFTLCGLWHGAAWNFALWGLWHGLGLAIQHTYRSALGPLGGPVAAAFARWPILGWLLTLLFVSFGWLLFFYPVDRAFAMAVKLLTFS
jgi:alginate O-acetyltransferase complex protein AlgI